MNENNKDIAVFIEQRDKEIQSVSFELLGIARELAAKKGQKVIAILAGHKVSSLCGELIAGGADTVYCIDDVRLKYYNTDGYVKALHQVCEEIKPDILLLGATSIGRDLAPRLSARLRTGLTADCTKLEISEDGSFWMTRPAFGGNLYATIVCPDHRPQMSTVRPGVMKALLKDDSKKGEIINIALGDYPSHSLRIAEEVKEIKQVEKIENAKVLVSVGRGVACENTIPVCREIATLLRGTLSASRAVVESGILGNERQVGQTGKTVRPDVYLALGISGAVQHLAGMEESQTIIAVNRDSGAAIFKTADLGIVTDACKMLPYLKEEIKKAKNAGSVQG